jgi:hypothetical protein
MHMPKHVSAALVTAVVLSLCTIASAEETWTVRSGTTTFEFDHSRMAEFGLAAEGSQFSLLPASDLTWGVNYAMVDPTSFSSGGLLNEGTLVLRDLKTGTSIALDGFRVEAAPDAYTFLVRKLDGGEALLELTESPLIFDAETGAFTAGRFTIAISPALAAALGRPDMAGTEIGRGQIDIQGAWTGGNSTGQPPVMEEGDTFKDVKMGILDGMTHWDREGTYPNGVEALSMATTSCNVGDEDVPWRAPMAEDHPGISMHLYRELNGRLEMVGMSDIKHGFYALSSSQCTPCLHPSDGSFLGVGCSDTYGSGNNADRNYLAPRNEWDPFASTWECTGSHFAGGYPDCIRRHGSGGHGVIDHRLAARDADLGNPGATYYYEGYYLVRGDQDKYNNIASRICTMSWTGSYFFFTTPSSGNPLVEGPRLDYWGDQRSWANLLPNDGNVIVAVKTTDLGGGMWNYDYGVYNFDLTRAVRSFSVPVGTAAVSDIEFHDPDLDDLNDWSVTVAGNRITWSTDAYEVDPDANALTYGLLYNFRFTADAAPVDGKSTLTLFRPGVPGSILVSIKVPPAVATSVPAATPESALRLAQNRPNPVGVGTTIRFELPAAGPVQLAIYDTQGRRVRTLVQETRAAGAQEARWDVTSEDGQRVAPGVYYYRLSASGEIQVRSLIVVE